MPNRILKESICTSEEIDSLTPEQEVFFYRLLVACDDYGLMDARPAILKARCYPLKAVEIKRIQMMLEALSDTKLIGLYEVDGKQYLCVTNWEKHQTIRAQKPKYPYPKADDFICKQMQADVPVNQSNPIQSESNPNPILADASLFDVAWAEYPKRPGANKSTARKAWDARIKAGVSPEVLIDGARAYAAYCTASGTEPQYIKQAATFFGPGEHYLADWTPMKKANGNGQTRFEILRDTAAALTGRSNNAERFIEGYATTVDRESVSEAVGYLR